MFNDILAYWTPGPIEIIIVLIVFSIPVVLIVLAIKFVLKSKEERLKQRLEMGKIADELEQVRKKIEPNDKTDSASESG